jgi:hypothetical protein
MEMRGQIYDPAALIPEKELPLSIAQKIWRAPELIWTLKKK